jgi:hypothetical protein
MDTPDHHGPAIDASVSARQPIVRLDGESSGRKNVRNRQKLVSTLAAILAVGASSPAFAGCVVGVSPGSDLLVRDGPSEGNRVLGSIPADACGVRVSKLCRSNWCEVGYQRVTGWASMKFLDRDRNKPLRPRVAAARYRSAEWEFLGARSVDFRRDRDIIPVGRREGRFGALQVTAKGGDIDLHDLKIVYANGSVDDIPVKAVIRAGGYSGVLDLRGRDRAIKEIRLSYGPGPRRAARAEIQVYGLEAGAPRWSAKTKRSEAPVTRWELLGSRTVTFKRDFDVVQVGRRAGRIRALQLLVADNAVFFDDLKVVYGNGRIDDIPIRKKIPESGRTRVIDLKGEGRIIKEIRFVYRSRAPMSEAGSVAIYGLRDLG